MKKLIIFLCSVLLIGPTYSNASDVSPNGILLKDYESISFYINTSLLEHYKILKHIVVLPEEDFMEQDAIEMIQRIDHINTFILKSLYEEGVFVKLFNGAITDEPTAAHLKGTKPRGYSENGPLWDDVPGIGGSKVVLAKIGSSEKGSGHGSVNLELHELAHTIDQFVFDSVRDDMHFQSIWKKEVAQLFPGRDYFENYPEEYFAETFALYYLSEDSREFLKNSAPLTYEFIEEFGTIDH